MTDHAQQTQFKAQGIANEFVEECCLLEGRIAIQTALTNEYAAGRRAGLEEAAKIAEGFAITPTDYIRDADTCFDIAMKIRAKAKEGV